MTEKLIHVNAYTRSDGTSVKEHYRNVDSKAIIDDTGYLLQDILEKVQKFLENSGETFSSDDLTQTLEEMLGVQNISTQFEENLLEALSQAKTQREYSPLYNAYMRQRDMNKTTENALQHLKYAIDNGDYNAIVSGLEEYNKVQKENQNNIKPLEKDEKILTPKSSKQKESLWNNIPKFQKPFVRFGMLAMDKLSKTPDARALLDISSTDMTKDCNDYLEQNGTLVDSIEDLPLDLQDRVRTKVKDQLNVEDSRGVVLRPDSSLSIAVSQSPEFQDVVKKHVIELLRGEIVSDSVSFRSTKNLHLALGRADIVDAYINQNGAIVAYVLDTYDFNKDDPDWKVQIAYNVQKYGLFTNYFVLSMVVVPKEEWLGWFSENM